MSPDASGHVTREAAAPPEIPNALRGETSHRLDALMNRNPLPRWRAFAWPVMVLLIIGFIWANYATLDEVAVASGEVVPQGRVKVIQHLEGGIIQALYVSEGDTVREGEPLLQLDLGSAGANQEELQVQLDSLVLTKARLAAEANGQQLDFPKDVAARRPEIVSAQRQAYEARKRELASSLTTINEQIKQRELSVQELEAKQSAVQRNYKLASERLTMSKSLLSEGLTAKMEHLQLEAEVENLQGELKSLKPQLPKARAAVDEAKSKYAETQNRFQREAQDQLGKLEDQIAKTREQLQKADEQGQRAEIKSPTDGIVKNMRYNTIGGVVKPGEPIMEIVPTGEQLVIEAKLSPVDRGYVTAGQKAVVKISTYDYSRYGGLTGQVLRVAPDSSTDKNGVPFFRVVVQTDKNYLGKKEGELPITPGMVATVDIHTGKKTVMEYLIKPVLKLREDAFHER